MCGDCFFLGASFQDAHWCCWVTKNRVRLRDGEIDKDCPLIEVTEPKTNADRIRAMTDVELAMWMAVESWNYPPCYALIDMEDGTKECVQPDCTGCWLNWLEQESGT